MLQSARRADLDPGQGEAVGDGSAPPADSTAYSISILVADLESLRVHLGVPRIDLLGFSFGGELALEYALAHPGRVEHLVLEAPTTGDWDRLQQTQLDGFHAVSAGAGGEEVRRIVASTAPLSTRWDQVWSVVDERIHGRVELNIGSGPIGPEAFRWRRDGRLGLSGCTPGRLAHSTSVELSRRG